MKTKAMSLRMFRRIDAGAILIAFVVFGTQSHSADISEDRVGRSAVAQILGAAPLHESEEAQRYVNLLGNAIARYTGSKYPWHFAVADSSSVNAFAAPGGYVLVGSGLLKLLDSEHELATCLPTRSPMLFVSTTIKSLSANSSQILPGGSFGMAKPMEAS
jgi:predicted Zn-dependent protease